MIGGTETHALTLGLAQAEAGHDVSFVIAGKPGGASDLMEEKGFPVYYADGKSEHDLFGALRIRKIFKQLKPDVIHSHGMARAAFVTTAFLKGVRVYTAHCYPSQAVQAVVLRKCLSLMNRWIVKFCDGYITVTDDVRKESEKRGNFMNCPWAVIYNGIDLSLFHPSERATLPAKESGEPIELLLVGRMEREKHPDDAIRILALFREKYDLNARLTFCGDGSSLPRSKEVAQEMGLSEFVTFAGRRNDVHEFMRKSHGLLFLSDHETFAQVPLEAIACGCPVFAYRVSGGFHEWFKDEGSGGVISEERTPESLAEKVAAVLADQNQWEQLRRDGVKTAQNFSDKVMAEKTVAFYEELLSSR